MIRKLLAVGLTALVLFGVSAYTSYALKKGQASSGEASDSALARENGGKALPLAGSPAANLKAALRPSYNPEAEAAVSIASNFNDRAQNLKAEEQRLSLRKKLLDTIYQDMRSEEKVLETKKKEVSDLLKSVEQQVAALEQKSSDAELRRKLAAEQVEAMKKTMLDFKGVEQERVKQMATMYDTMEPESAAKILQQMAEGGNLDTAVQILASMRERQAARVLAQLQDPGIVVQMLDRMKNLKKSVPTLPK